MQLRSVYALISVMSLAAGVHAAAKVTPEQKAVEDIYGKRIAEARETPGEQDDLKLAREMLITAHDEANSQKLRRALADRACQVAMALDSRAGMDLAEQAMRLADSIRPYPPSEKIAFERDLAVKRLEVAQAARLDISTLRELAKEAARAYLAHAERRMGDPESMPEVKKILTEVRVLVGRYRLLSLTTHLRETEAAFRQIETCWRRLRAAEAKLQDVQKTGSAPAIAAAKTAVGKAHLAFNGDLVRAAPYLAGTGDEREAPVAAAAAFLKNPKAKLGENTLTAVKGLLPIAKELSGAPRRAVGETGVQMCQAYLAGKPSKLEADKARLLIAQLETVMGETTGRKIRRKLAAAYGGINCKIEPIDDERIRAIYDFSAMSQLSDWSAGEGKWTIHKSTLVGVTQPYSSGHLSNKLRFRGDRPVTVTVKGKAKYVLGVTLQFRRWGEQDGEGGRFRLSHRGCEVGGAFPWWRDERRKIQERKTYTLEIAGDGKGKFTFSVNGFAVHETEVGKKRKWKPSLDHFHVTLSTEGSDRSATAFYGVIVEGQVLPSPDWVPPEMRSDEPDNNKDDKKRPPRRGR